MYYVLITKYVPKKVLLGFSDNFVLCLTELINKSKVINDNEQISFKITLKYFISSCVDETAFRVQRCVLKKSNQNSLAVDVGRF